MKVHAERRPPQCPAAFTLIEVLVTIATLIIVMGLMVSLARYVRRQSADQLTKDLLVKLDALMAEYADRNDSALPEVTAFLDKLPGEPSGPAGRPGVSPGRTGPVPAAAVGPVLPDESALVAAARANNRDFVRALRTLASPSEPQGVFGPVAASIYDQVTLRDAWGSEIVFMPKGHPLIGTAPQDNPFFFSAGPDGRYLTQEDNLYSYEEIESGVRR